jgi:hypothetical protein
MKHLRRIVEKIFYTGYTFLALLLFIGSEAIYYLSHKRIDLMWEDRYDYEDP